MIDKSYKTQYKPDLNTIAWHNLAFDTMTIYKELWIQVITDLIDIID